MKVALGGSDADAPHISARPRASEFLSVRDGGTYIRRNFRRRRLYAADSRYEGSPGAQVIGIDRDQSAVALTPISSSARAAG